MNNVVALKPKNSEIILYEEMCLAIAAAHRIDEVKDIKDKARAIQLYARIRNNPEAEQQACEIRLRAERRMGELLRDMEKAKGGGDQKSNHRSRKGTGDNEMRLADLGITKKESSRSQHLAAVPEEEFEQAVKKPGASASGIIAATAPPKPRNAVDDGALWLCGRLRDFHSSGLLDRDPNEVVAGMLPHMQESVRELVPAIVNWLKRIK